MITKSVEKNRHLGILEGQAEIPEARVRSPRGNGTEGGRADWSAHEEADKALALTAHFCLRQPLSL
jgi:hypothetical protein